MGLTSGDPAPPPRTVDELLGYLPQPPYRVRAAAAADLEAYVRCHVASLVETYGSLQPDVFRATYRDGEATWVRAGRERDLADSAFRHVVAEDAVGVAVSCPPGYDGWDERQPALRALPDRQLDHLYCLRATHGAGLGRALVDETLGDASAYLWVLLGNDRARAFYAKSGFAGDGALMPCGPLWGFRMMERLVRPPMPQRG